MYLLYFDPGLGAMIIQAIVAAIAGFLLFSKNLVFKIKTLLGLAKHKESIDDINITDTDIGIKEEGEN